MLRKWKTLFALSGALVLLVCIGSPVLLPYPLLVWAYLRGWRLLVSGAPWWRLLLATLLCTLVLESSAWLDNYIRNNPEPALFHPQLIPDLIFGIGVYAAWWLTWWLVLRRYRFTTLQVFLTTGLYGIIIEQQGKIFLTGLAALPAGLLLWLFVAVAYGSTMALATFLVRDSFTAERDSRWKYPLAWAALFVLTLVISLAWGLVLQVLNFVPPRKLPMHDYPLW